MKEKWQEFSQKFEAFEPRERMLLVGAALAFVYFLWEFTFYQPRAEAFAILEAKRQAALQGSQKAEAERSVLEGLVGRDPFTNLRRELSSLQQETATLDKKLKGLSAGLISPTDLPLVLKEVLSAKPKVRLISLTTLPAEEVLVRDVHAKATPSVVASEPQTDNVATLYRHGVSIVLESSFTATLAYLRALESANWQFHWDNLHYQVKQHPLAQITINVYTLSAAGGSLHDAN